MPTKIKPNLLDYEQTYSNFSWDEAKKDLIWFPDGKINIASNVLDKHARSEVKDKTALIWVREGGDERHYTFLDIFKLSNKFANFLKQAGVNRGDRVFFFLSRVPEIYYGFLGCLRAGAIPGTLFPAFQKQALLDRLKNSGAKLLITEQALLGRVENIKKELPHLEKIVTREELIGEIESMSDDFEPEAMKPTDPAYMLYTSATGNTPVCGIVAPHLAILQQHWTAKWVLDLRCDDLYWCTADPGWVTGIAYGILAPWSHGVTQIAYEGRFDADKWYSIIEKYKVTVLYTAPTALRMLEANSELSEKYRLSSLRHICSVGEPLNPSSITWSIKTFGIPIYDTWWQTETGGMMITNFLSVPIRHGSMGKPVPGIRAAILDDDLREVEDGKEGNLVFKVGWPSMMVDIWGSEENYKRYFSVDGGWFISGDRAIKDKDGYFWFVARADDVIKTSGERVGPFEVESCLLEHPSVIEAGVIGKPDPLRGQIIKAFVVLKQGVTPTENLKEELQKYVKDNLARHAFPREIEFIDKLPKNRSGKIVRRLLKAKELGLPMGDTSTLED